MRKSVLLLCALLTAGWAHAQTTQTPAAKPAPATTAAAETPAQVVQRQLEAYNARDAARFAATYADDVELLQFPATVKLTGRAKLQEMYAKLFAATPQLHCTIVDRTVLGNKVIDHERVTGLPGGQPVQEAVAVYEVENGLIRRVTFIY